MTTPDDLERILGTPSAASWTELTDTLDACTSDELDALLERVEPAVDAWPNVREDPWNAAIYPDDLRVAPKHWIADMAAGIDSPKHRLVRVVDTTNANLNTTKIGKLLDREHLTRLRVLHLADVTLTKTLFKKVRTSHATRSLEHLRMPLVDAKAIPGIEGEHHLSNLRELTFDEHYGPSAEDTVRFLSADAFSAVEVVHSLGTMKASLLTPLSHPATVPNLHTLGVFSMWTGWLDGIADCDVIRDVDRLKLGTSVYIQKGHASSTAIKRSLLKEVKPVLRELHGVTHFDLSFFAVNFQTGLRVDPARIQDAMRRALIACQLPESIERLSLGPYYSDEVGSALESHHSIYVDR